MKNKKTKAIIIVAGLILVLAGYLLWANKQADHYAQVSRETQNKQEQILALEKSVQLWPKTENILSLADLYISIGKSDLAEEIMLSRGDPQILNKLGNLYLSENNVEKAENAFGKAKNKKENSDSLKGLILVMLKNGDRGGAESYLNELNSLDIDSAKCYTAFTYLNDFERANNTFKEAKNCDLYGLDNYFATYKASQNPLYLKLEAANLYYSKDYLNLAENDILALIKEKDNYRDAYILASNIYEKVGNNDKANEYKQKALELDPVAL